MTDTIGKQRNMYAYIAKKLRELADGLDNGEAFINSHSIQSSTTGASRIDIEYYVKEKK